MVPHWAKRQSISTACPSGSTWHACGSIFGSVGCCRRNRCSDDCPEKNLIPAHLEGREQTSTYMATSTLATQTATATATMSASTAASNTASASPAPTVTAAASDHKNIVAIVGGAAGGGFFVVILVGIVIFFWLHTRKSRRQHRDNFDHRISDAKASDEMIQKTHVMHVEITQVPPAHARPDQYTYHSPYSKTSRNPYVYRHYSAEHFRFPETASGAHSPWKTSHQLMSSDLASRKYIPSLLPPAPALEKWHTHRRSSS